jgi:hypothetical protein
MGAFVTSGRMGDGCDTRAVLGVFGVFGVFGMLGVFGLLGGTAALGACSGPQGPRCIVSADCDEDAICVDGVCRGADDAGRPSLPGGDGEGEGNSEGEGEDGGTHEGGDEDPGEDPGEGEGEGEDPGEGEGEGEDPGEGEGEGEGGGSSCSPACGAYQQCVDGGCAFVGELCATFGEAGTVAPFSEQPDVALGPAGRSVRFDAFLSAQTAATYFYNVDRVVTSSLTALPALQSDPTPPLPAELLIEMTAQDFDPYVAVVQEASCTVLVENDDAVPGDRIRSLARVDLLDVDARTHVVASSFVGDATGSYGLRLRPTLCGQETDTLATWNLCVQPMATRDFTCSSNPCARDAGNNLVGKYCCLNANCGRTGNEAIFLVDDPVGCN